MAIRYPVNARALTERDVLLLIAIKFLYVCLLYPKGSSVTPYNFLNVLQGKAHAVVGGNGRVLNRRDGHPAKNSSFMRHVVTDSRSKTIRYMNDDVHRVIIFEQQGIDVVELICSSRDDRIFVYFADHGGSGVIGFPQKESSSEEQPFLTAKQLNRALEWMHRNERYDQLVFYLEACDSGSMFENILRNDIGVYAVTAASIHESSYATYCSNYMYLPCLGDTFSVNWMEDSDEKEDLNGETLAEQFSIVQKNTFHSHVMQFGNLSIAQEPVARFQGGLKKRLTEARRINQHERVSWPSREVMLMEYITKYGYDFGEMIKIMKIRQEIKSLFTAIIHDLIVDTAERRSVFEDRDSVRNLDCHDDVVQLFFSICLKGKQHEYALQHMNVLNNLCIKFNDSGRIMKSIRKTCKDPSA